MTTEEGYEFQITGEPLANGKTKIIFKVRDGNGPSDEDIDNFVSDYAQILRKMTKAGFDIATAYKEIDI